MELNEALNLVADFLQSQKLTRTYKTLIEEAGMFQSVSPSESLTTQCEFWIISGDWPSALKFMQSSCFKDSRTVYESFYSHLIQELCLVDERHLARLILDEQKDLLLQNWY